MKTIFKYKLSAAISIEMPELSEVLSAHEQGGEIYLWALVNPQNINEVRHFRVLGTGHKVPDKQVFINTVHLESESLVFHVFESFQ